MSGQPKPVPNDMSASWDLVLQDIESAVPGYPERRKDLVIADIKQRDSQGEKKYGVRLQPYNGRDSLQDAYEEVMDLVVYLRNCYSEGQPVRSSYYMAISLMMNLRDTIYQRDCK